MPAPFCHPPWIPDQVRDDDSGERRGREGKYKLVSPAKAGVQGHKHQPRLPLWIPDHVRDDDSGERRGREGKFRLVSPAKAGVQSHKHQPRLPLWIPDQVRGDDVIDKRALTLRSVASRRGAFL